MPKGIYIHKKTPLAERFWSKVRILGPNDCWEFMGSRDENGRGSIFNEDGKLEHAHRVAYRLVKGEIPDGKCVCHSCDNPPCCNPEHLWPGTRKENSQDAEGKGRLYHHWPKHGKDHPCFKIQKEQRTLIATDSRSHRVIAKAFGISKTQVGRIKRQADTAGGNW